MLMPFFHAGSVAADADGGKDGVPEFLHGFFFADVGEDGLGPAGNGYRGDAPGEAAAHLKPVKVLQGLAGSLLRPDDPAVLHAAEVLGVRGGDGQVGGAFQGMIVEEVTPPQGHGVEDLIVGMEVFQPGHGVIVPVHHHFPAARRVGLLGAQPGKIRAFHRGGNDQPLSLLDIQADPN